MMEVRRPAYFDDFRCLAGACPDSCCKDWDVQIDEETAEKYRALDGELGAYLKQVMYQEDGQTYFAIQSDKRCPMWRDDGLCRLQVELGEQALCNVCRDFPRLRHDYGDFVELGLELSCPEAARLILNAPSEPFKVEALEGGTGEYDREAMDILLQLRQEALSILENHRYTPAESLALLLVHGYRGQAWLDGGEKDAFDPEAVLEMVRRMAQPGDDKDLREFFLGLEILTPEWKNRLEHPLPVAHEPEKLLAMARYFVERYYLQAVSDYDLVGRVKLTVISCLLVQRLGGDFLETAQRYSKEIENDADNVDAILDGAYTAPALADARLLGWLLG